MRAFSNTSGQGVKHLSINCGTKFLMMVFLAVCILGCSDLYEVPEVTYTIKKGEHKSRVHGSIPGSRFRSLKSEFLRFTVRFDSSAVYNIGDADQADVNKLFGFSDCNSLHQSNSARFGWTYNRVDKVLDVSAYVYKDSQRIIKHISTVEIGKTYIFELRLDGNHYEFSINGATITRVQRGNTCETGLYYLLYPYFGGNQTAPHDIRIYIEELLNQ